MGNVYNNKVSLCHMIKKTQCARLLSLREKEKEAAEQRRKEEEARLKEQQQAQERRRVEEEQRKAEQQAEERRRAEEARLREEESRIRAEASTMGDEDTRSGILRNEFLREQRSREAQGRSEATDPCHLRHLHLLLNLMQPWWTRAHLRVKARVCQLENRRHNKRQQIHPRKLRLEITVSHGMTFMMR